MPETKKPTPISAQEVEKNIAATLDTRLQKYLEHLLGAPLDQPAKKDETESAAFSFNQRVQNSMPLAIRESLHHFIVEHNLAAHLETLKNLLHNRAEKEEMEQPLKEHAVTCPVFTADMKHDYTILVPQMLPVHFALFQGIFRRQGYNLDFLESTSYSITEQGLQNVHNDTCYPALLAIGQLLDAVKSGKYDLDHIALLLPQTGGGCRASNYVYLLKKALEKNGLNHIPVIALRLDNFSAEGLVITNRMLLSMAYACFYGDMILWLKNQTKPYEVIPGHTDKVIDILVKQLDQAFVSGSYLMLGKNYMRILNAFKQIKLTDEVKPKVGIVGEIYMKYAPLGNNDLENYLISQGAQPVVTGVLDFIFYSLNNTFVDAKLYNGPNFKNVFVKLGFKFMERGQRLMTNTIRRHSNFMPPASFTQVKKAAKGCIGEGVKMGEGWLLTGEMIDLIEHGVNNIISAQPFGCLPNHIVAKGMIRAVKERCPGANIVAIDYDPGASRTNQENRIKLLLANANAELKGDTTKKRVLNLQTTQTPTNTATENLA